MKKMKQKTNTNLLAIICTKYTFEELITFMSKKQNKKTKYQKR